VVRPLAGDLLRRRPSPVVGALVACACVALCTAVIYPLKQVAPVVSLGVVYLLGVLLVSTVWGLWLGVATSLASAAAFNFFHIPPVGRFTISDSRNWVALVAFLVVAVAASSLADVARVRAEEADRRREEADLAADLARLLLGGELRTALRIVARRLAVAIGVPSVEVTLSEEPAAHPGRLALALEHGGRVVGMLIVPESLEPSVEQRVRERLVPALEATLGAALEREALIAEVVETAALRRSDSVKTAILRAVSHDLRTPLTAILAATDAVRDPALTAEERDELGAMAYGEAIRLGRLIDQLLDLSRLQAGAAVPHVASCSIEEILRAAVADQQDRDAVRLSVDSGLPLLDADPVQLERAFANLIDNAVRHGAGRPVLVRARMVGPRLVVRVVDRGSGVPSGEQERIFEPFYRPAGQAKGPGSGLGLAIAKGFVEANRGRIAVESVPGQGTSFVVQLPVSVERSAENERAVVGAETP